MRIMWREPNGCTLLYHRTVEMTITWPSDTAIASSYTPSLNVLFRGLDVVTKGRGPLIPLVRSTGGV